MKEVTIESWTTKNPLSMIGYHAGYCYNSDISDVEKNIKRGINCLKSGHLRVAEFPKIYLTISGYSAKVIREWYTHIIDTSRLQSSTRYIDYSNFEYVIPPTINKNKEAKEIYKNAMEDIQNAILKLKEIGITQENFSGLLPLNYTTKITCCLGLRELINIVNQRSCKRAYWEFQELIAEILKQLEVYSPEWKKLFELNLFVPKCEVFGYCPERKGCGRYPTKEEK